MKILCDCFGHKYKYYHNSLYSMDYIRVCKHCGKVEHYADFGGKKFWSKLVGYTDQYAKEKFKDMV